jgi:CheY-like chemotaxis protein
MLMLLSHLLKLQGFSELATCDNGPDALQLVDDAQQTPQLIFCDLQMPGMDGREFLQKLEERGYSGGVVLVSGEDAQALEQVGKRLDAGPITVLGGLQKPVLPKALAALLEGYAKRLPEAASK